MEYELPVINGVLQTNSRISTYSNYSSDTSSAYSGKLVLSLCISFVVYVWTQLIGTNSLFSGSDTMGSSVVLDNHSDNDMDLTGLQESTVDSEDEYDDLINSMESLTVR